LEVSLDRFEWDRRFKNLDLDAELERAEALPDEQARARKTEIRGARAYQRCLRGDPEAGFAEWAEIIAEQPDAADPYLVRACWVMQSDPAAAMADLDRAAVQHARTRYRSAASGCS